VQADRLADCFRTNVDRFVCCSKKKRPVKQWYPHIKTMHTKYPFMINRVLDNYSPVFHGGEVTINTGCTQYRCPRLAL